MKRKAEHQGLMEYRASIIGCGRVAWMLEDDPLEVKPCTHMGAYTALKDEGRVDVVAASDVNAERLFEFGRRYGVGSMYIDYRELLEDEAPDIVSICAYAPERFQMVMDAIASGVRGIWCEKAFATSLDEASRMAEECEAKGVTLIVSHMRRWSAEYRKAKEIIDSGGIGVLQSMVCHFSGSLLHTGTHAFDVLRWFGGPVEWVEGMLEGGAGEYLWDTASDPGGRALIQFKNGSYATVHGESRPYFFFEFDILGSRGRIRIGNNDLLEYYIPKESRHYTGFEELAIEPFPRFEKKNIWVEALTNLMDAMEGKRENLNGPIDGLNALETALAIHESARAGGRRVHLPLYESNLRVRSR